MLTAMGGDRFAIILEFEFLSRIMASMQSMNCCRHEWRLYRTRSNLVTRRNPRLLPLRPSRDIEMALVIHFERLPVLLDRLSHFAEQRIAFYRLHHSMIRLRAQKIDIARCIVSPFPGIASVLHLVEQA
jgi:hypothetical protein